MTRLLGAASPGLGSGAANVLTAVRRLSGDRDGAFSGVQGVGDGVLHGVPGGFLALDGAAPLTYGSSHSQQRGLFHGGQYATPMWLARGNPMCHTDVAVNEHVNVAAWREINMEKPGNCRQFVVGHGGFGGHPCGKAVKGEWDGEPMCGVHLAGRRRRQANTENWNAEWAAKKAAGAASAELVARLADIDVSATTDTRGDEPGVHLTAAAVDALVARLKTP